MKKDKALKRLLVLTKKQALNLITQIINESMQWLENPDNDYPFKDLRFLSKPLAYGSLDQQVVEKSLNRLDLILAFLHEHKPGLAYLLDRKIDATEQKRKTTVKPLIACGYGKNCCLRPLQQPVRNLVATLQEIKQVVKDDFPGQGKIELKGEAAVLAVFLLHPELSDTEIAETAGVYRTSLYRMKMFQGGRKYQREIAKQRFPCGSKNGLTGDIEAWARDDKDLGYDSISDTL